MFTQELLGVALDQWNETTSSTNDVFSALGFTLTVGSREYPRFRSVLTNVVIALDDHVLTIPEYTGPQELRREKGGEVMRFAPAFQLDFYSVFSTIQKFPVVSFNDFVSDFYPCCHTFSDKGELLTETIDGRSITVWEVYQNVQDEYSAFFKFCDSFSDFPKFQDFLLSIV